MKKIYFLLLFVLTSTAMSAQLVLNEILFDPASNYTDGGGATIRPGDANRDGLRSADNDEFIELVNAGAAALDITGYKIYDKTSYDALPGTDDPRHVIGDTDDNDVADTTVSIAAGGIYVVFGGGTLTTIEGLFPSVTFEKTTSLNLTNTDEIIYITDASGTLVIEFNYDAVPYNVQPPSTTLPFVLFGSNNNSLTRYPAITGDFGYHLGLNGEHQSAGELPALTSGTNIVINEIFSRPGSTTGDANGSGGGDTDDEFVELYNTTASSIDISGYQFFDRSNAFSGGTAALFSGTPRHVVPASTTLAPGEFYVVFGDEAPTTVPSGATFDSSSTGILSMTDGADYMIIADASGNYVTSFGSNSVVDTWNQFRSFGRDPDATGNFVEHDDIMDVTVRFSPGEPNNPALFNVTELDSNKLKLYVSNNILTIDGNLEGNNNLNLYDFSGRLVYNTKFSTGNTNSFNLSHLSTGLYIVNIENSLGNTLNKKIVIR